MQFLGWLSLTWYLEQRHENAVLVECLKQVSYTRPYKHYANPRKALWLWAFRGGLTKIWERAMLGKGSRTHSSYIIKIGDNHVNYNIYI
tara:strand:- start:2739 stop:3005 length:267 start_codon:yes stop_codon:yes gene_type:complete